MSEIDRLEEVCLNLEEELHELIFENKRLKARIAILENREESVPVKKALPDDYENEVEFPMGAEEPF